MKNNRPEIHFVGFTDDWEQRELGDLVERIKSYSLSRDVETGDYTGYKYIHYGDIHTKVANIIDESTDLPNIKSGNYELVKKGDLVLADASEDYQGIALPAVITIDTKYKLVSGLHTIALRPIQADSMFLYYLLHSPNFRKYGYKTGTGMKVFGISTSNLLKFYSGFPSNEEQEKIGGLFKQLEETIALHQRKHEKLINLKKAMLQKMFPQNGESVPEIRFRGFRDNWEQHVLGDKVEFYSGLTYSPDNIVDSGTLVLRSSNVKNGELVSADNVYVNPEAVNSQNVEVGDVIVVVRNGSRNLIGKHACVKKKMDNTVIGAFMTGIRSATPSFTNALLDSDQFTIEINKNLGATINQITTGAFKKMKFYFPSHEEQEKIGAFFEGIDNTIALHQAPLNKLQQIKKSLLKKMFI